jgi:hypothetical protein
MSHSRLGLADGWGLLQSMRFNQDRSAFVCAFQVTNKTVFRAKVLDVDTVLFRVLEASSAAWKSFLYVRE